MILPYLVSGRVDWHEDEFGWLSVGRNIFGCQRILVGNPQGTRSLTSWFQATPHEREVGMPHPRYESLCHLVRCCTKFCFKSKCFPSFCLVPQVFVLVSFYVFLAGFKQFETKCLFSIRVANGFAFESRECGIPSGSPVPLYIVVACTVCVLVCMLLSSSHCFASFGAF